MRWAMVQIQGVFAELDRTQLVRRLRKGRDQVRKEKGRCEGPLPYGQLPGESPAVERIKELRAQKPKPLSLQKIADALNAELEKYPTRTGAKWSKVAVGKILGRVKSR